MTSAEAEAYSRAALPSGRTHWREARFCVVDLELTGLDSNKDCIISFGAVPIDNGIAALGRSAYGLCRPDFELPEASILIHGMRTMDLGEAPSPPEAIAPLVKAMTGRVVVAHAAEVEKGFLSSALKRLGTRFRGPIIDTEVLGRVLLAERGGNPPAYLSLRDLVGYLGLPAHRPHHALGDAVTTAQAFLAIATHLEVHRIETVRSLARAGDRLRWLKGVT